MNITFTCIGLQFSAEVDYEPYIPARISGPPEDCYPAEGGNCEITSLTRNGQPADFLLESDIADDLNEAAFAACEESLQSQREEAEEDRAQARADDRMCGY